MWSVEYALKARMGISSDDKSVQTCERKPVKLKGSTMSKVISLKNLSSDIDLSFVSSLATTVTSLSSLIIAKNLSENSGTSFSLAMKYMLLFTMNFTFVFCLNSSNFIRVTALSLRAVRLKRWLDHVLFGRGEVMETHGEKNAFILLEWALTGVSS